MTQRFVTALLLSLTILMPVQANQVEDAFLEVKQSFIHRDKNAQNELKQYIRDYPYTTYMSETQMMIGVLQVEKEKYKYALRTFQKVEWKQLERGQQPMFFFYRGYAFLKQGKFAEAASCFKTLRDSQSPYTLQGKYYYAYSWYVQGEYDKALPDFLELEHTAQYKSVVPYYIIQIYYARRQFDEVYSRAEHLLTSAPDNDNNGEIHRILGEIHYSEGRYSEAIDHLKQYEQSFTKQQRDIVRADIYLLGMADYLTGDYNEAITYLKRVKEEKDTLTESTFLHLGHSYVKTDNIEKAKLNYQAAMRMGLNDRTREEAMYNYALCTYQTGTALGESIHAFNDFLQAYPNTAHAEQVYRLMATMYMSSKNYAAALEAIERIKNPNSDLIQTKQYLRYQMGADAFVQGKMQETVKWMSEVINNEPGTSAYKTDAYYYRAEARYRLKDYEGSYGDTQLYLHQPDAASSANRSAANYLLGYTLFNLGQYPEAEDVLRTFCSTTDQPNLYSDAMNRIGDCCFNARAFADAEKAYKEVIDQGKTGVDYALFQYGYVMGLTRRYEAKAEMMEQLVNRFPKSDYADDALYERARACLQDERNEDAIAAYSQLTSHYPNSPFARKAALEKAMIYRNLRQYDEALAAYRLTIETYPGSEEAYAALDGMEQIYVETNQINEYIRYTKQLGKINMAVSSQEDSLVYTAAELQYMLGNYAQAAAGLQTYMTHYCPGGRYCTMAAYYAADSHYRLNNREEALALYLPLSESETNPYIEECCTRAAELAYDKKDYSVARTCFQRLRLLATNNQTALTASLGELRCAYFLGDNEAVVEVATNLLGEEHTTEAVRQEALYNRAKVYFASGKYGLAVVDLTPLAKDVRIVTGAEAKYLLAESYYHLNALDDAEQEIMSFAGMKTQHQYWLAKSLILLSDINMQRGETFQAKQYLLSLQTNYKGNDDIRQIVSEHLRQIEDAERPVENEENDDNDEE